MPSPHTCGIHAFTPHLWHPCLHPTPVASMPSPHTCGIHAFTPHLWHPCLHPTPVASMPSPHTCGIHAFTPHLWHPCLHPTPVATSTQSYSRDIHKKKGWGGGGGGGKEGNSLTLSVGPAFARSPPIIAASQTSPCKCPLTGASGCLPVLEQGPWML